MARDPLDLLSDLVACPSLSGDELAFARLAAGLLEREGFRAELREAAPRRPNVVASDGEPARLLFSTHLDTVPPFLPPRREGDLLYGRGACDAKGCFVAMVLAARKLRARGARGVAFLLLVGEEVDHGGAIAAARDERELARARPRILLGEPTGARLVSAQKGLLKAELRSSGVAAHSAFPERGVSAIHKLLDALERIRCERWPQDPLLGPTTLNVGFVEGGVAANVFAPEARATLMFRLVSPWKTVHERLCELAGRDVQVSVVSSNDPLRLETLPGETTCVVPFNTDASYLAPLGPVWLGGPGAIEVAHSEEERISLAELERGVDLYERLGMRVLAAGSEGQ
jgi:acetylornithine deacetylase